MTLLNAPAYDARRENRKRNLIVGSLSLAVLIGLLTLLGFILGHGWLFTNLPAEHRVKTLLAAVQAGDYPKAYGIWENDPNWQQHPDKYDYKLQRFTEDWTTASDWGGPVTSFHVDVSKRNKSGIVVAATINGKKRIFLYANKVDGTLTYFPNELEY
jgi:hypothetical protein